ncbi:MAG: SpoIID/LytB domain-containing protein [Bacteriovoracaceae bacterium]|nr:SpoIID/LytB domain-containing protein [Bacteriovoracaceae bacterium]
MKNVKLVIFLLIIFSMVPVSMASINKSPAFGKIPKVRIRVGESLGSLNISGTDLTRYLFPKRDLKVFSGRKRIKFNCTNFFKTDISKRKPILLASLSSATGLVTFENEKYKGKLLVLTSPWQNSCDVVHETDLENYIPSLLSKEMNEKWPIEALKAQAVAARTYALHKIHSQQVSRKLGYKAHYDLENSEKHQVSGTFFDITATTKNATMETGGEILVTSKGRMTPIFFHAESGGKTLLPEHVWDNHVDGYGRVKRPYKKCHFNWKTKIGIRKFRRFLKWYMKKHVGKKLKKSKIFGKVLVAPDRKENLKLRVYIGDRVYLIDKTFFRRFFGRKVFGSNTFEIKKKGGILRVSGLGRGHGVGMSQIGAKYLAKIGWDYKQILGYYFPGHRLKKIY